MKSPADKFTWQVGDVEWLEPKGKDGAAPKPVAPKTKKPIAKTTRDSR